MGISETEALALILGGAFLAGTCVTELPAALSIRTIQWVGGLAMLAFGLLDIARDHL